MDAKVTVEEMVAAIGFAARVGTTEPPRRLLAAQQYIIAAESQLAERDAQITDLNAGLDALGRKAASLENDREYNAELVRERDAQIANTEHMLREEWWLNHRCSISALYGDDGEMQCNAACCLMDFKREPLDALATHVWQRRLAKASEDMTLLEEARAQIAEMQEHALDSDIALDIVDDMVRRGNGAVVFSETETGHIGLWIGDCDENTKALGTGDTVYEAITEAVAHHPELGLEANDAAE